MTSRRVDKSTVQPDATRAGFWDTVAWNGGAIAGNDVLGRLAQATDQRPWPNAWSDSAVTTSSTIAARKASPDVDPGPVRVANGTAWSVTGDTTINSSSALLLQGTAALTRGAVLNIEGRLQAGPRAVVDFGDGAGAGQTLILGPTASGGQGGSFTPKIVNFTGADKIELPGLAASDPIVSVSASGVLTVTDRATGKLAYTLDHVPTTVHYTASASESGITISDPPTVPVYSHIVVVVEENHAYNEIIGNPSAPYINNTLAAGGALLTNYFALTHPSEPNYFALYAGSTFGVSDDNFHAEPDPTLATILQAAGKSFTGYVDSSGSDINHNPWEYFPEGTSVEQAFSTFPTSNFSALPTVSFVIPGVDNDMHNGTIAQGDSWLQSNIDAYAQWAKANNSLLAVVWDEDDGTQNDQVPAILYGANIAPGSYSAQYNQYNLLSTILAAENLTGPNNAATAAPINIFGTTTVTLSGSVQLSSTAEGAALPAGTTVASFTDANTLDSASGFTATITWGDGGTSAGTVSGSNGAFTVAGGHTYTGEGSFPLAVALTRTADNTTITPSGTIAVAEADVLTPRAVTLSGTAGQALSNVMVATFTDSYTGNPASDFAATINWGDGGSSAGTVSGSNGTFSVSGTHTYAAAGGEAITVTLSDNAPGNATATADSTANISGGALSGSVQLSSTTEGAALPAGTRVASFTDANTLDSASGFTATITWGDGGTSAGTVSGSNGAFTVAGGHTYTGEGSFPLAVALTRTADNTTITPSGTIAVAEADVLTPRAVTLSGTAGQALSAVTVATFTDSYTGNPASDFAATINWGDGGSSAGTVSGSNGTFSVSGTHTYAAAGGEAITVTLSDNAPGNATATADSTANISGGALSGSVQLSSTTEGAALPAGTTVASFTDANTLDSASGFTATITWGDGGTSAGTVSGSNGAFTVAGGHTYTGEGSFPLAVALTRTADNTTITPSGTIAVAEADVLTPRAVTLSGTAGQALSAVTVATFTDSYTGNPASDFAATINWGDGGSSAGTVSGSNGTFSVSGTHTYAAAGGEAITVTLSDNAPGNATATADSTANISGGALSGSVQLSSTTEGAALPAGTTVASFTDANTLDSASGFTATITWGDGGTSAGTVSGSNGAFTVAGGHTYTGEGSFPLAVALTRTADNTTITPSGTIAVAEADVLTPRAVTLSGTAGQALSAVTVATFTDSYTGNPASDFAATINWGDGGSSAGTVSGSNGTFSVSGTHTYAAAGGEAITVTLSDNAPGNATATADSTANISGGALSGSVQLSSTTEGAALPAGTRVASFTDANTLDSASGFTATITWGDGGTSAGTVSGSNGAFTVAGGHTYTGEGSFPLAVALTRTADNTTITPSGTIAVAEADVLTPRAVTLSGTAGQALSAVTVATFTDSYTGNPASDFAATINWGDGGSSTGTVSGSNGTFSVSGTHTYAAAGGEAITVTLSDNAPGNATATADSTANISGGRTGGRTISSTVSGPIVLAATDNPVTITGSGKVTSTGSDTDGIDGSSTSGSTIANSGSVTSANRFGISLPGGGTIVNDVSGLISGRGAGIYGGYGAATNITNAGTINARDGGSTAVYLVGGGSLTNSAAGTITGGYLGVTILGGSGAITNAGKISGGVYLAHGGNLTNSAGGGISGGNFGVFVGVGSGNVSNSGDIAASLNNGVYLQNGGSVTNRQGASISGPNFGVAVYGASGTVTNSGTISGGVYAVLFANDGANRLIVNPTAVFNGRVTGGPGTNTLELAGGTGTVSGLAAGSGTVSENGLWSFTSFQTIDVDPGGNWTLNGGAVATVRNHGTVSVAGSLHVTSAIDPASSGLFLLAPNSTLDVAAALGGKVEMSFLNQSELVVDDPALFGTNVGDKLYTGPLLENFGAGDAVDVKQFSIGNATTQYDPTTGLLQIANGAGQKASLTFETSSLGTGGFQVASDGGNGIFVTHS